MAQLFIPPLGTVLKLEKPWEFRLWQESRNTKFAEHLNLRYEEVPYYKRHEQFRLVTIPEGALLKVDRIYIRKGSTGFDSVSFNLQADKKGELPNLAWVLGEREISKPMHDRLSLRFWAKLTDVNNIHAETVVI